MLRKTVEGISIGKILIRRIADNRKERIAACLKNLIISHKINNISKLKMCFLK